MPIDWTKPQIGLKGRWRGIATVFKTENGWGWKVLYKRHSRSGERQTEHEAKAAADAALKTLQELF